MRARWIDRPLTDLAVAWCWLPVALVARAVEGDRNTITALLGAAFLISFLHQPLTLGLVYGDPVVTASRPRLYRWTPLVVVVAVFAGLNLSLALVAVIAGLWNAEHTLMQRYGLTRIYGRKGGDDLGSLEKPMYIAWLGLAMVWIAADGRTPHLVDKVKLGSTNAKGVEILQDLAPAARVALVPVALLAAVLTVRWWRAERSLAPERANPAKRWYVASTAALIVTVMVDPLAGFTAYVATHALEYFVVVDRSLRQRRDGAPVARATATAGRRLTIYAAYTLVVLGFAIACIRYEWYDTYRVAILVLGALHIFYDGFIWKLRRPEVASRVGAVGSPFPVTAPVGVTA